MDQFCEESVRGILLWIAAIATSLVAIFGVLGPGPLRWIFGCDLAENHEGKSGYQTTAIWVGYVLSSTALLVAAAQDKGSQIGLSVFYVFANSIPIGGLWLMLRTRDVADRTRHSFDRPTVWLTRLGVSACVTLLVVSTLLAMWGQLPLQPKRQIRYFSIDDVVEQPAEDEKSLMLRVKVDSSVYPQEVPLEIVVKSVRYDFLTKWSIALVRLVSVRKVDGKEERTGITREQPDEPLAREQEFRCTKPQQGPAAEAYEVEIYLRPPEGMTDKEIASAKQRIKDGDGLTLFDPRIQK